MEASLQEKQKKVSDFFMKEITLNPFEENSAQLPSLVFFRFFLMILDTKNSQFKTLTRVYF
jgi:hypothetical protein